MALVSFSTTRNTGDRSLPAEVTSSRLARSAKTYPGKPKNKKKLFTKFKNRRSRKATTKKARRKDKSSQKKNSRKNKKNDTIGWKNKSKKDRKARKNVSKKAGKKSRRNKKNNDSKKEKTWTSRKNKVGKSRKNKSKKNKKSKKIQNNSNSRKDQRRGKNSTTTDDCIKIAVDALYNGLAKKASNFDRQSMRIETRVPIIASKLEKAGDYADLATELNTTVVKCSEGSIDQAIADGVVEVLHNCKDQITTACAAPKVDQEQIDECKIIVKAFQEGSELCINATKKEDKDKACECWESEEYAKLVKNIKGCVIKESEKNVTDRFKDCKDAVKICNSAQKESAPLLLNCTGSSFTNTKEATTTEKATTAKEPTNTIEATNEAETLKKNIKALGKAKVAIKAVAGTTTNPEALPDRAELTCAVFIKLINTRKSVTY